MNTEVSEAHDVIRLHGAFEIILRNAFNGAEVERRLVKNTVVTAGRAWVLGQICSSKIQTGESVSYMAIGTSTAAPATGDSALASEVTRLAIGTFTTSNLSSNPPSWRAETSFATNQGNTTLAEVALLNSSASGTMLARATFATINKTTSNTLSISYTISN